MFANPEGDSNIGLGSRVKASDVRDEVAATSGAREVVSEVSTALTKYNPDFAAQQILGRASNVTPGGRTLTVHAATRIMEGGPGRAALGADAGMSRIDQILETGVDVRYNPLHPLGPTVRVTASNGEYVAVDAASGLRVVTAVLFG
jgi:hypothetical protein